MGRGGRGTGQAYRRSIRLSPRRGERLCWRGEGVDRELDVSGAAGGPAGARRPLLARGAGPRGRPAGPPDSPLHGGDFAREVPIGHGREIYLECHGEGSPTVILEAGLRSRSDFWSERLPETPPGPTVLPGVASFTRVCAYDRPGTTLGATEFSRSSPVPMPRTAADAVSDLHKLVTAAHLPGPYVLVGHSTGGLIVRLFAATYPHAVAGMVEVDALSEFLQGPLDPAQIAAYDELNNGPIEGIDYPDLEQILFRPSFAEMRAAAAPRPAPRHPFDA